MKLKPEDGYWSLAPSGMRDRIIGSAWLKKHKGGLMAVGYIITFILVGYVLTVSGFLDSLPGLVALAVVFISPIFVLGIPLGVISKMLPPKVDLPNAEFYPVGYCQGLGKRILNMVKEMNVGDHYIFLLNFHNLFYHDEHRLENPGQDGLNAIGRTVRVLPERQRGTIWTRNPFHAIRAGSEAGLEAADEQTVNYYTKKLGSIPEPAETVSIRNCLYYSKGASAEADQGVPARRCYVYRCRRL